MRPSYCPQILPRMDEPQPLRPGGGADRLALCGMSEMLMYRINQVPDRFYTKFLELMGIAPFPPTARKPTSPSGCPPSSTNP